MEYESFEIYLLDEQLNILYVIDTWVSLIWEISFTEKGIFDIYLPSKTELTRALNNACYIYKTNDRKGGYIEEKQTEVTSAKGDMTVISGYLIEGVTFKFNLTTGIISGKEGEGSNAPNSLAAAFNCFRDFGVNNIIVNSETDFFFYIVESDYERRGYPNLGELCYKTLPAEGYTLNAEILLDEKLIIFDFKKQRDRTIETGTEPVIVSAGMDSINNPKYLYSEASCYNVILIHATFPASLSPGWKFWIQPPDGGYDYYYNPENLSGIKISFRIVPADVIVKKIMVIIDHDENNNPVWQEMTVPDNAATIEYFKKKAVESYTPFTEVFSGDMLSEIAKRQDIRCGDVVTLNDDARGETYTVRIEKEIINLSTSKVLYNFSLGTPVKNIKKAVANLERRVL